jgi:hypothetical protein
MPFEMKRDDRGLRQIIDLISLCRNNYGIMVIDVLTNYLAGSGLPARHVFLAGSLNLKRLDPINMIEPAKKFQIPCLLNK